jgi:hypothetical protein
VCSSSCVDKGSSPLAEADSFHGISIRLPIEDDVRFERAVFIVEKL